MCAFLCDDRVVIREAHRPGMRENRMVICNILTSPLQCVPIPRSLLISPFECEAVLVDAAGKKQYILTISCNLRPLQRCAQFTIAESSHENLAPSFSVSAGCSPLVAALVLLEERILQCPVPFGTALASDVTYQRSENRKGRWMKTIHGG